MDSKLLNCPFCGGEARVRGENDHWVECLECHIQTDWGETDKAIAAWNRRADHIADATEMIKGGQDITEENIDSL